MLFRVCVRLYQLRVRLVGRNQVKTAFSAAWQPSSFKRKKDNTYTSVVYRYEQEQLLDKWNKKLGSYYVPRDSYGELFY